MMMKTSSRTHARSSSGVTLRSSYGRAMCLRRMRRLGSRGPAGKGGSKSRHQLVGENIHRRNASTDAGRDEIIAKQRGNRDEQSSNGREQRRRDARRDRVDVDIARGRDRGERDHDTDDRAEQPEKRRSTDRNRHQYQAAIERVGFFDNADVEGGPDYPEIFRRQVTQLSR